MGVDDIVKRQWRGGTAPVIGCRVPFAPFVFVVHRVESLYLKRFGDPRLKHNAPGNDHAAAWPMWQSDWLRILEEALC
ncbi:hypothetical protein V5799_017344 [Amblyomma americanum]|uniref:Uncharacterized protein n=1 Tax=Amblyomma americanum TaxID=6943 RepID=A0AAQ4F2I4_AMBAM